LIDSYYTPPNLAFQLIKYIRKQDIKTVADFCVGDGVLLRAGLKKWPDIECFGTDISAKAISSVRFLHPNWNLGKCDFLNENSQRQCKILKNNKNGFDLVLLNPPFSCVGGTINEIELEGKVFNASTAMMFLVEAIKYISKNGCLYAIMPISVAYSQKDKKLWKFLVDKYKLTVLEIPNGNHFKNCSPSIIFISINDNPKYSIPTDFNQISLNGLSISIFRGKVSMYTVQNTNEGEFIVHTTNLKNNKIKNLSIRVQNKLSEVKGPAVLIPRVGNPNPKKICVISQDTTYILSDCVLAILTITIKDAYEIKSILLENWTCLNELYKGTGARYITIERLSDFLGIKQDNYLLNREMNLKLQKQSSSLHCQAHWQNPLSHRSNQILPKSLPARHAQTHGQNDIAAKIRNENIGNENGQHTTASKKHRVGMSPLNK